MTDLAMRGSTTRAERLDLAVTSMQLRLAPMFPGGETQDTGRAIWTLSSTPLLVANGVIRYDARDFYGPESERELDSCLAVLSTFDVPWRFSAWEHLGADLLIPHLEQRGLIGTASAQALWLDLPGVAPATPEGDGIEIREAITAADHHLWSQIFVTVFGIPRLYADVFEVMVATSRSFSALAYAGGRPVGCLSLAIEDGLSVVDNIGVIPSARRRGVGRRLFEAASEGAAARAAKACVVVATPSGYGICARLGYHPVTNVTYLMARPPSYLAGHQRGLAVQPTLP